MKESLLERVMFWWIIFLLLGMSTLMLCAAGYGVYRLVTL